MNIHEVTLYQNLKHFSTKQARMKLHFQIHCLEAPSSITYNHKPTKWFCLYVNMTLMYNTTHT